MEMIDSRRFSRGALLDPAALKDVTVRRLKKDLKGKGFNDRQVKILAFTPDDAGDIVTMLLKKWFLSSPLAFGMTLNHYVAARAGRGLPGDDDYYDDFFDVRDDEEKAMGPKRGRRAAPIQGV